MRPFLELRTTRPRKSYFNVGERQKMNKRAELRGFYDFYFLTLKEDTDLKLIK